MEVGGRIISYLFSNVLLIIIFSIVVRVVWFLFFPKTEPFQIVQEIWGDAILVGIMTTAVVITKLLKLGRLLWIVAEISH